MLAACFVNRKIRSNGSAIGGCMFITLLCHTIFCTFMFMKKKISIVDSKWCC